MAKGLLSIVSIYEHLAKTIDSVRAWVQQHEKLIYQGMENYCHFFQAELEVLKIPKGPSSMTIVILCIAKKVQAS